MINTRKIAIYILAAIALLILFLYLLKPSAEQEDELLPDTLIADYVYEDSDKEFFLFSVDSLFGGTTEEYLTYLRSKESDADALLELGHFFFDIERYDLAVNYYLKSHSYNSDDTGILVFAAMAYSANAFIDEAEELFARVIKLQPDDADILLQAAIFYNETGQFDIAGELLRKVLNLDPTNALAAHHLSVSPLVTNMEELLHFSRLAAVNAPDEPLFIYNYALILYETGRHVEAEARLREMIKEYPSFIDSWLLLTSIYRNTDRPDDARSLLASALGHRDVSEEYKFHLLELMNQIR